MTLREWVEIHPRHRRREVINKLADACGVTEPAVRHWINGIRGVPARHVLKIIEASNGAVTVEGLIGSTAA